MENEKHIKIEIDADTIKAIGNLCEISGLEIPDIITCQYIENVTKRVKEIILSLKKLSSQDTNITTDLKHEVNSLKHQIEKLKVSTERMKTNTDIHIVHPNSDEPGKSIIRRQVPAKIKDILIIADVGVIMHQIKTLFTKFGCNATLVKTHTDAIFQLENNKFDCILFDLPTSSEKDLELIETLRKAASGISPFLIVLTIPKKDKTFSHILKQKGVDIVIEKNESWHMQILDELKLA